MLKEKILVVDDEQSVIEQAIRVFTGEGYAVTGITSGSDALGIIANKTTDILVVDLALPEIDGLELIERAYLIDPDISIVVMAHNCTSNDVISSLKAGAQSIVAKPFNDLELINALKEAFEKRHYIRENIRLKALMPLFEVSKSITSELKSNKLFSDIVQIVGLETRADSVSLMLLDDSNENLIIKSGTGLPSNQINKMVDREDEWVPYWVVETGNMLIFNDKAVAGNQSFSDDVYLLCLPLIRRNKAIGVLKVSRARVKSPFRQGDIELLMILVGQAAIAIENARLFQNIRSQKVRLAELMRKYVKAQEDERFRISEELHDSVAQWMVSASYHSQSAKELVAQSRHDEAANEMDYTIDIVDRCIKEIRRIMLNLRPQLLSDLGLVEAIQHNIESFNRENGTVGHFAVEGDLQTLPWVYEITIYRIILEALSNVRKHANADEVEVLIKFSPGEIEASVNDNGDGFDLESVSMNEFAINGMGLVTMKERVEMIGGNLCIESICGEGTKVAFSVPNNGNGTSNQIKQVALSSSNRGGKI